MHNETEYLSLVNKVINQGDYKSTRQGIQVKSLFGEMIKFDITDGNIPALTTKKMAFKTAVTEILWMLKGNTDSKYLSDRGIKIWELNTSRSALDSKGLFNYPEGDIGPTYGFNMRHYGDNYIDCKSRYDGIDQIQNVINSIKNEPDSRRHIVNLWDPKTIDICALPPCVYCYQFNVINDKLDLLVSQRSADIALGVPFNIIQGTIIANIIAYECGLETRNLIYSYGDIHAYVNHIDNLIMQCSRDILSYPILSVEYKDNIDDYSPGNFNLTNYISHDAIKFELF